MKFQVRISTEELIKNHFHLDFLFDCPAWTKPNESISFSAGYGSAGVWKSIVLRFEQMLWVLEYQHSVTMTLSKLVAEKEQTSARRSVFCFHRKQMQIFYLMLAIKNIKNMDEINLPSIRKCKVSISLSSSTCISRHHWYISISQRVHFYKQMWRGCLVT